LLNESHRHQPSVAANPIPIWTSSHCSSDAQTGTGAWKIRSGSSAGNQVPKRHAYDHYPPRPLPFGPHPRRNSVRIGRCFLPSNDRLCRRSPIFSWPRTDPGQNSGPQGPGRSAVTIIGVTEHRPTARCAFSRVRQVSANVIGPGLADIWCLAGR